jgi:hypothetical protein
MILKHKEQALSIFNLKNQLKLNVRELGAKFILCS